MEHPATGYDVLIVGSGHGGAETAIALRNGGFKGTVAIMGGEPDLPYERPPLSKEYLSGKATFDQILIRPPGFWSAQGITMLLGQRVIAVDHIARLVTLEGGPPIAYHQLVWAAGGTARRLKCEGADLKGVHTIRSHANVRNLRDELPVIRRAVVIGGGYIGLEAAAVLRELGKDVVLVEALDRVLARVAGERISRFYEAEHRARGVDIRLETAVDSLRGRDGKICGVRLTDGTLIECDLVIVGIGIVPAVAPLLGAGAVGGERGIVVDAQCRTSLFGVFAVGDCAVHANRYADGAEVRVESVQNATDQAVVAAKTIIGQGASYETPPWFWSDQYDLKLQSVGLSAGHDDVVLRGDPAARSFSVVYLKQGRVVALDCVNSSKDYVQGRTLVARGTRPDRAMLARLHISLREVLLTEIAGA
ncbi:pyridine nucleotide-disulfide oxidoreductase [Sphingomonas panacis]|uniref:Pyridine nucleotide-disulfide oxidoreductase n=1 Tax=Sphingomonas panacis TaxID=1560345 RepID=A0A1B3ZCV0_9SPHN|nr:FAD-dependent oxidoreductase [Sphingomonas panacis]AOH85257.1 pyridine nucleotide-disulfide oxidoreductase [Sphingomonas panacis]